MVEEESHAALVSTHLNEHLQNNTDEVSFCGGRKSGQRVFTRITCSGHLHLQTFTISPQILKASFSSHLNSGHRHQLNEGLQSVLLSRDIVRQSQSTQHLQSAIALTAELSTTRIF